MNYQKYVEDLFKHACLAACYSYLSHRYKPSNWDWIRITEDILDGVKKCYLEEDAYVALPVKYINNCAGETICKDVQKVPISSLSQLPEGQYAVEFKMPSYSHFIVCDKYGIVFDPSGNSNAAIKGKIVSYRKVIE